MSQEQRRRLRDEEEGILKSYSPPSYESFIPKNEDETSEEKAASVLQHIDNAFKGLHETVRKLNSRNKVLEDLINQGSESFDLRIIDLKDELGDKPNHLEVKFDAPSLWSAVGGLADVVSQLEETYSSKCTKKEMDSLEKGMLNKVEATILPLNAKCEKMKESLVKVAKGLKQHASYNTDCINSLQQTSGNGGGIDYASDIERIDNRLAKLEHKTSSLAQSDKESVRFHNMGFVSKNDADSWLETHAPGGNFGFVFNFYTLVEHVHQLITGVDSLKQLQNAYKLKLSTIFEALSVTSFEVSVPRFLSSSEAHVVVSNDASYFS